jgi:HSP20 family protein
MALGLSRESGWTRRLYAGLIFTVRRYAMNYLTLHNPIQDWLGALDDPFLACGMQSRGFAPAVDLYEEDDAFVAKAELPGIAKGDLDISLKDNVLTIKGEKKGEREDKKEGRYFRRETWAGSFERSIRLPAKVDAEKVNAEMKDGVLTIRVPKLPEAKPFKIDING